MKFVCPVCGYVYEGDSVPEGFKCPICGAAGEKFIKQDEGMTCLLYTSDAADEL